MCAGTGLTPALVSGQFGSRRVIYASTNVTKVIPENAMSPDVLKQSLKLMSMSSDSIHDAVFVCREKGAAHLRDRLTLRY